MALVNPNDFFFYVMGSDVNQPSPENPTLLQLQSDNNLKSVSWGMWYCDKSADPLNNANQLYIWADSGNLFSQSIYTANLVTFAENGGSVGVTLGGNKPASSTNLVNPIVKLYNRPQDFIDLLMSIKTSLSGHLHFIDVDIENPQLGDWGKEKWLALNETFDAIRKNPSTKDIQIRLTIPQSSSYWLGMRGYQGLIDSGILSHTSIDYVNIMDMDMDKSPNPIETWVNWVVQTAKDISVSPDKIWVTFEASESSNQMTTADLVEIVKRLENEGFKRYSIFTIANGVEKFEALTAN